MTKEKAWHKEMEGYFGATADFEPDPMTTALILVDAQYVGSHPDYGVAKKYRETFPEKGNYYTSRLTDVYIPNCIKLLNFFRKHHLRVAYTAFGSLLPDTSDALPLRKLKDAETERKTGVKVLFNTESAEYQIIDELKPQPDEPVFNKKTRNAFCATSLDHTLRMMGIESVAVGGTVANICVIATAIGASDLGYKTILLDDASASVTQADHDACMKMFALFFGKVMDTDELIEVLCKKL
ncbi:cysteine hydrolase family protein [Chloroflexota bacterium]